MLHAGLALTGTRQMHAHEAATGSTASLARLAREAWQSGLPVVLMFSLPGCAWCDALRREHLNALAAQQGQLGVRFIELNMSDRQTFPDIKPDNAAPDQPRAWWQHDSAAACARALRVRMAPTVLFMGPQGELAERLVGYGMPDFYGAYLEQRIAQARERIKAIAQ